MTDVAAPVEVPKVKKSRFAKADLVRLELSDGDFIVIRSMLNVRQKKQVEAAGFQRMLTATEDQVKQKTVNVAVDMREYSFARTLAYVHSWSFVDENGAPVPFDRDALEALTSEAFEEIENRITKYLNEQEAAKKADAPPTPKS